MKKLVLPALLAVALLIPTVPAWADGAPAPGLFHWLQQWLDGAVSWVAGDVGPQIDPAGLTDGSGDSNGGPQIGPTGLTNGQSSDEGDGGPQIDPMG